MIGNSTVMYRSCGMVEFARPRVDRLAAPGAWRGIAGHVSFVVGNAGSTGTTSTGTTGHVSTKRPTRPLGAST